MQTSSRKSSTARVSVITPFFNSEKFIQEAIESVLAQTFSDWEMLLIDDGSNDRSTTIAKHFADQHPSRIRFLEHPERKNLGKSASRNLGVKNARGEYLAFLDSDDVFMPEKLERQATILDEHSEAAMVYGPTLNWYEWKGNAITGKNDFVRRLGVKPEEIYHPPHLMNIYLGGGRFVPCTCGMLVRTNVLDAAGGWEDEFINLYEDQVFLAKIVLNHPVYVEGGTWDRYRQHPDMSSMQAIAKGEYSKGKSSPSQAAFFRWLSGYLKRSNIRDEETWRLLRRALLRNRHPRYYRWVHLKPRAIRKKARSLLRKFS